MNWYLMNTRSKVHTDQPQNNEFGHTAATFVWLQDQRTGAGLKVVATYDGGNPPRVGEVLPCVQDTGLGHRSMNAHVVLATRTPEGEQAGVLPARRVLPFWVTK